MQPQVWDGADVIVASKSQAQPNRPYSCSLGQFGTDNRGRDYASSRAFKRCARVAKHRGSNAAPSRWFLGGETWGAPQAS